VGDAESVQAPELVTEVGDVQHDGRAACAVRLVPDLESGDASGVPLEAVQGTSVRSSLEELFVAVLRPPQFGHRALRQHAGAS
jgi:hypothetical protein